jgi:hypothetical protein
MDQDAVKLVQKSVAMSLSVSVCGLDTSTLLSMLWRVRDILSKLLAAFSY